MRRFRSTFVPLALVLVMVLSVGAGSAVAQSSGNDSAAADTYVVNQGSNCYELATLGDGTDTVEEFYEYHPNSSGQYSSHGTTDLQESQVSQLFVYNGEDGQSLVFLHDEYGDGDRGGAIRMDITGLPESGSWPVEDDDYGESTDDNFDHSGTSSSIDWMWSEGRNDGGAFLGLGALEGTITIEPAFGEESWAYQERSPPWDEATHDVEWRVRTGAGEGEFEQLDKSQSITIERGTCSSEEHTAELTASPDEPAIGDSVTLDATASTGDIVAYHWDVDGDGTIDETTTEATVTTSYDTAGSVDPVVFAEASNGENATATTTVTVTDQTAPEANADVSSQSVAPGESIEFAASGSTDNVGIDSYAWDFGDGSDGVTGETATHAYENDGEYEATLTVTDEAGNQDTATVTISVEATETDEPPTAVLDAPDSVTVDQSVSFDASASTDDNGIVEYKWDFDGDDTVDATTDTATTTHTYTTAGDYDASVTVVDSAGNENTDSASVTVTDDTNTGPVASIDAPAEVEIGTDVELDASASTGEDAIETYKWDVDGDGTTDQTTSDATVTTTYEQTGEYPATVTVVDAAGNEDTASTTITVTEAPDTESPTAVLEAPSETKPGESVTLDASDSTDNEGIVEYKWDVDGDGTVDKTTTEATVTTSYEDTGEYDATVTAVDAAGNDDTTSTTITVASDDSESPSPTPVLDVPLETIVDKAITFDWSSLPDAVEISEFRWDFNGDGTIDRETADASVTKTYQEPGEYEVTVTLADKHGNTYSATATITVQEEDAAKDTEAPTAALTAPDTATTGTDVTLDASASTDNEDIAKYKWDVDGDGTIDQKTSEPTTTTTYKNKGDYQATVTVVDAAGNTDTAKTTIGVTADEKDTEPPTATIDAPSKVEVGETFTAKATNLDDESSIKHICWYVDGETGPDGKTMSVTFDTKGMHTISLLLKDTAGNEQKITHDVEVVAADDSDSTPDDGGDGDSDDSKNSDDSDESKDNDDSKDTDDSNDSTDPDENDDSTENDDSKNSDDSKDNDDSEDSTESDDDNNNNNDDSSDSEDSDNSDDSSSPSSSTGSDSADETDTGTANISVTAVKVTDADVQVGETVDVTATVENTGNATGSQTVSLTAAGPAENETTNITEVSLDANETQNVTHSATFDEPGEYDIHVENDTVSLTVHAVETATESPTETATATDTPTETETSEEGDSSTFAGISGLGIATGLIAISIGAIAFYRRY